MKIELCQNKGDGTYEDAWECMTRAFGAGLLLGWWGGPPPGVPESAIEKVGYVCVRRGDPKISVWRRLDRPYPIEETDEQAAARIFGCDAIDDAAGQSRR